MSQPKITNDQLAGPLFDIAHIVRVDKNPGVGAFSSIKDAIDSITTATALNPIAVFVGPGWYTEDTIIMKPYVKLVGWAGETHTFITPTSPTNTILYGANSSMVQGFSFNGATGVGGQAVAYISTSNSTQGTFRLSHIRFLENEENCHIISSGFDNYFVADNLYFVTFGNSTKTHLRIESTGTAICKGIVVSSSVVNITGTGLTEAMLVTGPYADATFNGLTLVALGANSVGDGIAVQDGAHLDIIAGALRGFNKNIVARNVGAAPIVHVAVNLTAESTTRDFSIEHPGTSGLFSGAADISKVFIDPASTVAANYSDLRSTGGTAIVGPLYMGPKHDNITDFTSLLNESTNTGVLAGGNISQGVNPLDVDISAGYGYVGIIDTNIHMRKLTWTTQTLTLPDDTVNYVYVNSLGVITSAIAIPDETSTILLGRVKTLAGVITFIGIMPTNAARLSPRLRTFAREAIGCVFKTGSAVSENVTPFHVDVSSGNYYYADLNYLPTGGSNINFYPWIDVLGVWTKLAITNLVNHTQYNNPATGLVALTAGFYTKHTLWVGGDGVNEQYQLIIGQAEYASLATAQAAPLPPISSGFAEITTPIAAIIVQEGAANITEFVDIRPRIGFQNPSTSAATVHGNLVGLLADDHLQYLLINGTRAMTGGLNMGTNNITSVGTVDGVTVSAHESRHLPNGADPLTTAAPLTALSLATTNDVGTANSLARSDHSHALTGVAPSDSTFITISANATLSNERTLAITTNQLTLTDGGANNPATLAIADDVVLPGTGAMTIPKGTNLQYPAIPSAGMLRYNTTDQRMEVYNGSYWGRTGTTKQIFSGSIAQSTGTTTIAYGNTAPVITDGTQLWTQTITPVSVTSKIMITFTLTVDASINNRGITCTVFRGNTLLTVAPVWISTTNNPNNLAVTFVDAPGVTTPIVYSARIGTSGSGSWYVNQGAAATFGGGLSTSWWLQELSY